MPVVESTPTVPLYVYIVAGAVGCVLVGLLMLIFIVKFCKKYHMKKELERVFNVRVNSVICSLHTSASITATVVSNFILATYLYSLKHYHH